MSRNVITGCFCCCSCLIGLEVCLAAARLLNNMAGGGGTIGGGGGAIGGGCGATKGGASCILVLSIYIKAYHHDVNTMEDSLMVVRHSVGD